MAEVKLTPSHRRRLCEIIVARASINTPLARLNLLDRAGLLTDAVGVVGHLSMDAPSADFAAQLVRELQRRGTLEATGHPALVSLLLELREVVRGQESEAAFLDELLAPYRPGASAADPAPGVEIPADGERPLKLFVSYRRRSWAFTQRLADDLHARSGADVFVDITGVDESNFEQGILRHLRSSDIVLVVVSEYTFTERIQQPGDWVRREIALALALNKPIVLALVDGRTPPPGADLPEDIRAIGQRQGINFYPEYWEAAVQRFTELIEKVAKAEPTPEIDVDEDYEPAPPPANGRPPTTRQASQRTLDDAIQALDSGDHDRAIFLLQELIDGGFKSRFVSVADLLAQAQAEREATQRRADARREYALIARLATSRATLEAARTAWAGFAAEYADFAEDPEGLAERLADPTSPASTPDQQRLLDIMLDSKRPAEERAEAGRQLAGIGDPRAGVGLRPDGLPDVLRAMCGVPAGIVEIEEGIGRQSVAAFQIAMYPVTYSQYRAFLDARDGYRNAKWWSQPVQLAGREQNPGKQEWPLANHPAENVSWYDAVAFCRWLTSKLSSDLASGTEIRLPTEAEWQLAASGPRGWQYPWGNEYVDGSANLIDGDAGRRLDELAKKSAWDEYRKLLFDDATPGLKRTTAVGIYPHAMAPNAAVDLSGNVWEWTLSKYKSEYEGGQNGDLTNDRPRVVRGGSWDCYPRLARAAYRFWCAPDLRSRSLGFRVVVAAPV